ncbi:MAG TPA: AAA family ATPase [Thermoanaerobaculia bacterium]|jgi:predicted ATPase|nr:AAA family ATPase [Thermoanaerobaculia bacterium]
MISRFKVEGFKSLSAASLELGAFNVFIGANGSGKSNLLEAIGVMGAAAFGSVEPEPLRYRGVRLGVPALYKSSFKGTNFRRIITLEAATEGAIYRLGLDNPIDNPSVRWRISSESLKDSGRPVVSRSPGGCNLYDSKGRPERITPEPDQTVARLALARWDNALSARGLLLDLLDFAIYSPTTPVLRGVATDEVFRDPLGLSGGGLPEALKQLTDLSGGKLGPFDLDDIWEMIEWADQMTAVPAPQVPLSPAVKTTPTVLRFRDRFMRKERNTLSAYAASEGALYVLFLLALVSHPVAPGVFAIDNFDQALHPRLAQALTRLISQQVATDGAPQVLATTHNPLVLDGLDLTNPAIRLFAVDRDQQGVTQVRRVEVTPELMAEAERGLGLSRLWVMGRFGGVPRLL